MKIGNFDLNKDGVYIIAELSANHNGSLQTALDTIKAAKEIGANAIKLQTYRADTITLNSKNPDFMIDGGTLWDGKNLYELYEEAYTPWEWHKELFDYARSINIDIFSTPFDKSAVDFLEQFNPSAYKIASFEITDYELVRYTASKGKPIIISTGVATIDEIQDVVDICRSVGNHNIILLKCTSEYPAKLDEANLKTIPNMRDTFGVYVIGFSDHTIGIAAPVVAVGMGAKIIEKHITIDRNMKGTDQAGSLGPDGVYRMVRDIREAEKWLGIEDIYIDKEVLSAKIKLERSVATKRDLKVGEIIKEEDLHLLSPGDGYKWSQRNEIVGKTLKIEVPKNELIYPDMINNI